MNIGNLFIPKECLNCQAVYEAAQAYRCAPLADQAYVIKTYENLLNTIAMRVEEQLRDRLNSAKQVWNVKKDKTGLFYWREHAFKNDGVTARLVCIEETK